MTELTIFKTGDNLSAIDTTYDSADAVTTKVFAVSPGPLTILSNFAGPTSIEVEFSFTTGGSPQNPPAATDTNWYTLVGMTGAAVSSTVSVLPGRSCVDPSIRGLAADDTLKWGGRIPPYMSWMRVRIKKTGAAAVTSLNLSVFCNTPSYSS